MRVSAETQRHPAQQAESSISGRRLAGLKGVCRTLLLESHGRTRIESLSTTRAPRPPHRCGGTPDRVRRVRYDGILLDHQLMELVADRWMRDKSRTTRVLLGDRAIRQRANHLRTGGQAFSVDVSHYGVEDLGVSLRLSAQVIQVLKAPDAGALQILFIRGATRPHARV